MTMVCCSIIGLVRQWSVLLTLLLPCSYLVVAAGLYGEGNRRSRCERITIPMCQDMPYNMTRMPNLMDNVKQNDAAIRVHEFQPLVEYGCSKHLRFFLCSLFAPMCTEQVDVPIPSCRAICEEVKASCLPVMKRFNFQWPSMLNCSRFPVPEKNGLCMQFPNITEERTSSPLAATSGGTGFSGAEVDSHYSPSGHGRNVYGDRDKAQVSSGVSLSGYEPVHGPTRYPFDGSVEYGSGRRNLLTCPDHYVVVENIHGQATCVARCGADVYFRSLDKQFAETWMTLWSSICFISTFFTVLTFWVDTDRFKYPERPIIFLTMCYLIYCSAFLLRAFLGAQSVSCDRTPAGDEHIIIEGLDSTRCIVVFLLLYYFGMASSVWWVVLTLNWFLAAGRKWGHEAIEAWSSYFHVAAWGLPAALTITVLALRRVDGDELTGMCYAGNQDLNSLFGFVIIPLCVFTVLGILFVLLGFVALFRIRSAIKHSEGGPIGQPNIEKLEKLMVRIGVFSGLYTVPAICVLICHIYEFWNFRKWRAVAIVSSLECAIGGRSGGRCKLQYSIPSVELFMLKIFMSLVVGVTSGVWIWSSKTWHSWRKFFHYRFISRKYRRRKSSFPQQIAYQVPPSMLAPLNPPSAATNLATAAAFPSRPENASLVTVPTSQRGTTSGGHHPVHHHAYTQLHRLGHPSVQSHHGGHYQGADRHHNPSQAHPGKSNRKSSKQSHVSRV